MDLSDVAAAMMHALRLGQGQLSSYLPPKAPVSEVTMILERLNYIHALSNQCRGCLKMCAENHKAYYQAFQPGSAAVCAPIRTGAATKLLPNYLNLFVQNRRYQPS